MKFINFSIVTFSLFLTIGILIARFFQINFSLLIFLFSGVLIGLIGTWSFAKNQLYPRVYFGVCTYSCFILLGIISYQLKLPSLQKDHYSNLTSINEGLNTYQFKILESLKPDRYTNKYLAQLQVLNLKKTTGTILINIPKEDTLKLVVDDILLVSSQHQKIRPSLNPHQFDYSIYMKDLGVSDQLFISKNDILAIRAGSTTIRGKAEKTRIFFINQLKKHPFGAEELSIIQALILGQKKEINASLYREYAAAGAIHILAVSGLHVGIIYFILIFLFSPLKRLPKGTILMVLVVIICLWLYAFITGLSPSVLRAVTMFSFFAFANMIQRETNSINTLFLSYFTLLLINPRWLFFVGFQLSYLAVFFIVWIIPIFNKWYYPKNKIAKRIWGICTVTIAAQLGIIPLSLFYFNQFAGLFFITNLLILPFLGILIGSGILVIFLASINTLPESIATIYNTMIRVLNDLIGWIAHQDSFILKDIFFNLQMVIGSYAIIITSILLWNKLNYQRLVASLLSVIFLISISIWNSYKNSFDELIIFHKSRHTLLGYKHSNEFILFKTDSLIYFANSYPIKNYRISKNVATYQEKPLPSILQYDTKNLLVLDSLGVYPHHFSIHTVLLSNNPKVHLRRMIDSLEPKLIIADGTNYTSYINRWDKTCKERGIPFYYTGIDGAYQLKAN